MILSNFFVQVEVPFKMERRFEHVYGFSSRNACLVLETSTAVRKKMHGNLSSKRWRKDKSKARAPRGRKLCIKSGKVSEGIYVAPPSNTLEVCWVCKQKPNVIDC